MLPLFYLHSSNVKKKFAFPTRRMCTFMTIWPAVDPCNFFVRFIYKWYMYTCLWNCWKFPLRADLSILRTVVSFVSCNKWRNRTRGDAGFRSLVSRLVEFFFSWIQQDTVVCFWSFSLHSDTFARAPLSRQFVAIFVQCRLLSSFVFVSTLNRFLSAISLIFWRNGASFLRLRWSRRLCRSFGIRSPVQFQVYFQSIRCALWRRKGCRRI